jgi:hypothetical protein
METTVKDISQKLRAPLPSKLISWRVGRKSNNDTIGQALPFITPRVIQNLLDDILGPDSWRNSFLANTLGTGSASVVAIIELKLNGEWIAKSDAAQVDSFKEDGTTNSKEMAIKGAYSDAFKRAAVMWGLGRYLYEFEAPWVTLDANKRLTEIPILPLHMLPEDERADAEAAMAARAEVAEAADKAEKAAEKPAEAQAEKQAEKPADKPAAAHAPAETPAAAKADEKPAAPAEAKQQAAPVQADVAEAKPQPAKAEAPSDEALALERSAAMVDQELGNKVADVKPAAVPAKDDASATATAVPGMPENLNDEQLKTFKGLIEKIEKKLPTQMLRNYVNGPKAASALPDDARAYLLALLDKADAAKDAAAA